MFENELKEWLKRIESYHPDEIEMGLERVEAVANLLSCQEFTCPVISVAGTNGKGSTVACLTQLGVSHGLNVGSYSSPHLFDFNERISVNAKPVDNQTLISAFEKIENAKGNVALSFFEFTTLAALTIFKDSQLDLIILEVGLGGRLDAVNIIDSNLSIITSIGIDHEAWLGNSRELIAIEKAGIARKDCYCIVSEKDRPRSLFDTLKLKGAMARFIDEDFSVSLSETNEKANGCRTLEIELREQVCSSGASSGSLSASINDSQNMASDNIDLGLDGQSSNNKAQYLRCDISQATVAPQNIATAIIAYAYLGLPLHSEKIRTAIANTQLKGRFQVHKLGHQGQVIFDLTHNPAGAEFFVKQLKSYLSKGASKETQSSNETHQSASILTRNVTALFGVMSDKDISGIVRPFLPHVSHWVVSDLSVNRAASALAVQSIIQNEATQEKLLASTQTVSNISYALETYLKTAKANDILLVFGSFYSVGPALQYFDAI